MHPAIAIHHPVSRRSRHAGGANVVAAIGAVTQRTHFHLVVIEAQRPRARRLKVGRKGTQRQPYRAHVVGRMPPIHSHFTHAEAVRLTG